MSPLLKRNPSEQVKKLRVYCLASALIALGIMLFVYLVHSNTLLFGKNTVLRMDLYHQYGPLYSELYDRIVNGYSLTYSWRSGAGGGFLGNLFNYCSSPFAIVMLLLGHENMPEAIAVMILLKAVFSATAFTYYLNKTNKRADMYSVAFGQLYAFCGFFVAYSWNIMWLDAMAIFPLVILGVERIIDKRKPTLFICTLTYTMITNYYMAYMVTMLCVLYFLYYYFSKYDLGDKLCKANAQNNIAQAVPVEQAFIVDDAEQNPVYENATEPIAGDMIDELSIDPAESIADNENTPAVKKPKKAKKHRKKKKHDLKNNRFWASGWTFAASGLLCFFLSAFALLPVAFCLTSSSATSANMPDKIKLYFNIFDFIVNHFACLEPTIRSSGDVVLPNIYSGMIAVLLLPLYFMSEKISARKKVVSLCMLGVFFVSFNANILNFMWHGFHFPNDLPYRYSFAYSFFILCLAYQTILNLSEYTKKNLIGAGMGVCLFIIVAQKTGSANLDNGTVFLSALFAVIYVIALGAILSKRFNAQFMKKFFTFLVVLELLFCNTANYVMQQPKSNYTSDYKPYHEIADVTQMNDKTPFYRTELTKLRARMDPCWYGYNGVSTFSSMAYEKTANVMYSMGLFSNKINSYTYYPQTPIFNSVFSLKYIYDNSSYLKEGDYYKKVAQNDNFTSYEYKYWLPLAFSVNNELAMFDDSSIDPFEYQNAFMKAATGIEDILVKVEATDLDVVNFASLSLSDVNLGSTFNIGKTTNDKSSTAIITTTVEEPGYYYVYAGGTKLSELKIKSGDLNFDYASTSIQPLTMDTGYKDTGDTIKVEFTIGEKNNSGTVTYTLCRLDMDKFKEAYNKIQNNGTIQISEFNESDLKGTVKITNDNAFLFTSIPYDESWQIYVDGTKLDYFKQQSSFDETEVTPTKEEKAGKIVAVDGGFIGFDIAKGEHTIEMRYVPRGLGSGIKMTVFGLLIVAFLLFFKYFLSKKLLAKGKRVTVFNVADEPAEAQTNDEPNKALTDDVPLDNSLPSDFFVHLQEEDSQQTDLPQGLSEEPSEAPGEFIAPDHLQMEPSEKPTEQTDNAFADTPKSDPEDNA